MFSRGYVVLEEINFGPDGEAVSWEKYDVIKTGLSSNNDDEMCESKKDESVDVKCETEESNYNEEKLYVCYKCKQVFTYYPSWKVHMLMHTDALQFDCETCGRHYHYGKSFKMTLRQSKCFGCVKTQRQSRVAKLPKVPTYNLKACSVVIERLQI